MPLPLLRLFMIWFFTEKIGKGFLPNQPHAPPSIPPLLPMTQSVEELIWPDLYSRVQVKCWTGQWMIDVFRQLPWWRVQRGGAVVLGWPLRGLVPSTMRTRTETSHSAVSHGTGPTPPGRSLMQHACPWSSAFTIQLWWAKSAEIACTCLTPECTFYLQFSQKRHWETMCCHQERCVFQTSTPHIPSAAIICMKNQ